VLTVKGRLVLYVVMVTPTALETVATSEPRLLRGTPVVPGLAFGPVLVVRQEVSPEAIASYGERAPLTADDALASFDSAAAEVAEGYAAKAVRATGAAAEVLAASAGLTRDRSLRQAVQVRLEAGDDLLTALSAAVAQFVEIFTAMGGLMAERATDLRDIERRLTARLVGEPEPGVSSPEVASVLVASDLAPADTASLQPGRVLAIVTERGGPTSHTAIIARQLGIPCVVGVSDALTLPTGAPVLVDGGAGTIDPGVAEDRARGLLEEDRARRAAVETWAGPGATADGAPVTLLANVADGESARVAALAPVEGVGLFRTELCFLDRRDEPDVEEQAAIYAEVLRPFAGSGHHVVVRTLDAGSDKPIAFATLDDEENPALGVRGLRLAQHNPALLEHQLDGIAAAAASTGVATWVMAPMVATVAEASEFAAKVRARGLKAGVMVEVPSAALLAARFLEEVDFLSIGTNDLTQYVMAADRLASDLAHLTDPWQPAVLHLVAITAEAGRQARKPVGVCGEAAADPLLAVALVGMGVTSLSMAPAAVRAVGAQLSLVTRTTCEDAAEAALAAADPLAAREAVRALLR
jgi:phosphoenolpyruvate-protein phosphotransferase (PTS system enzyme I)